MRSRETTASSAGRPVTFDTVPLVENRADLLRIARAMEGEAAARYARLVAETERRDLAALADVFRRLEMVEREHLERVSGPDGGSDGLGEKDVTFEWSSGLSGSGEAVLTSVEELEVLTPWGVLDLALINEERAFAFYARVAAKTADPDVRALAETLAAEELDHVAWLRLHRLRAWPEERETREALRPRAGLPSPTASLGELQTLAGQLAEEMIPRVERVEATIAGFERSGKNRDDAMGGHGQARASLREDIRRVDLLYRSWISVCEQTKDEGVLRFAQGEADETLGVLARARDILARARGQCE